MFVTLKLNYLKLTLAIIYFFINIGISNGMILDEKYSSTNNQTVLDVLNTNIDKSYSLALLAVQNLEDTENINIQINKLRDIIDQNLIKNIERINSTSNVNNSIINSILNIEILIGSINDKIDMILGGASPVAMAYYSEEIAKIFEKIYNGIDKNNNNIIEENLGEGCLNYLNSISDNNK